MEIPDFNLEELEKQKEENFKDRLEFIKKYAEWVKKTDNSEWSKQQAEVVNQS
jgi:hypothetical protein